MAERGAGAPRAPDGAAALDRLDAQLARLWRSGRNAIVAWRTTREGLEVLAVPQYLLSSLLSGREQVLAGGGRLGSRGFAALCDACEIEPYAIAPAPRGARAGALLRRYGITRLEAKAVVLFDIVGFSRYAPLAQVSALNSLASSINVAYRRAREHGLRVGLARSTTGDGFYLWNREHGFEANVELFCVLMLALADNFIGAAKDPAGAAPAIRSGFHIGDCYEYHLPEGERPGPSSFLVGDATIELARLIDQALAGQILVGSFVCPAPRATAGAESIDTPRFIERAGQWLERFAALDLARERITGLRCYLTGEPLGEGRYDVVKYILADKHGLRHEVFNAKLNLQRRGGEPVLLGLRTAELAPFAEAATSTARLEPGTPPPAPGLVAAEPCAPGAPAAGKTILVVDDDPDVRETAVAILAHLGHRVLTAASAAEAQALMDEHQAIDLLFTDVVMPGRMSGLDLARYARARMSRIRVLCASGYDRLELASGEAGDPSLRFLAKPYGVEELIGAVRALLEEPRGAQGPGDRG